MSSESFVNATKEKLEIKAHGCDVIVADDSYALRELPMPYTTILWQENDCVRPQIFITGTMNDTAGMSET